jgi:hypothetical protein
MWRQEARWKMTNKIKGIKVKKITFEKINQDLHTCSKDQGGKKILMISNPNRAYFANAADC